MILCRPMPVLLILVFLAFGSSAAQAQTNPPTYNPEDAVIPIRALLAIAQEPVRPGSSCDQGSLIPHKPGPQQVGDMVAVLLAYQDSGVNLVRGSCKKDREGEGASCVVTLRHQGNHQADPQFAVFRFKLLGGQAQASSLECELSP